jgi:hypothetical protein
LRFTLNEGFTLYALRFTLKWIIVLNIAAS